MDITILNIACAVLWVVFITCSTIVLLWSGALSAPSQTGSVLALWIIGSFYAATIFRDPQANRDALSYVQYSQLAQKMDAICYLIRVRFEPIQAIIMWVSSNLSGSYQLYFAAMASIIIVSSIVIYRAIGSQFLLFTALTFPQFGFINSMATVRWGAALYMMGAAITLFSRTNILFRGLGGIASVMLHFGTIIAALSITLVDWKTRIVGILILTAALALLLPTSEINSGSGVRYVLAFGLSASLIATVKASLRNDPAYRDHLVLVGCAAIISTLYFVSPHLTRFAGSLLFVSYLPLAGGASPLLNKRLAVTTLLVTPFLALCLELYSPSCVFWSQDALAGPMEGEMLAGEAQYKGNLSSRAFLFGKLFGADPRQCP